MSEQLSAEAQRELLHEVAGLLGIHVKKKTWCGTCESRLSDREIDAINEGRVVDAMRARGFCVYTNCLGGHWSVVFENDWTSEKWHDSRLVAVLLAAREALKAEEGE